MATGTRFVMSMGLRRANAAESHVYMGAPVMFETIKKFVTQSPVVPANVGRVSVTFFYETPDYRGTETRTFDGEWLDTKGVFGRIVTDATDVAQAFIDGTKPIETAHGHIPRRYVYAYVKGVRESVVLQEPNAVL
jgi:hypothetical protein